MDLKMLVDTPPWEWPENAGKTIQTTLADRRANEADRTAAAELAGNLVVMNDGMADALMAIVSRDSEPEELRARAAISLGPVLEEADLDGFDGDLSDPSISEQTFNKIQSLLQRVYLNKDVPKQVRRRALEASVRASQPWQENAIREAYASGDREWILTAVFGMRWIPGFDDQILESLKTEDEEIHYEAVNAAGDREVVGAWDHVLKLVQDPKTPQLLLLAAIEAVAAIRPSEARHVLSYLVDSPDEEIAEAVDEALMMVEARIQLESGEDEDEEEEEKKDWVN